MRGLATRNRRGESQSATDGEQADGDAHAVERAETGVREFAGRAAHSQYYKGIRVEQVVVECAKKFTLAIAARSGGDRESVVSRNRIQMHGL